MIRRTNFPFNDEPASKVTSPCIGKCYVSNKTGFCEGCSRSLSEIVEWERGSDTDKLLILEKIKEREKRKKPVIPL